MKNYVWIALAAIAAFLFISQQKPKAASGAQAAPGAAPAAPASAPNAPGDSALNDWSKVLGDVSGDANNIFSWGTAGDAAGAALTTFGL